MYKILVGQPEEGDHSEDFDIDGRIIIKIDHSKIRFGCMDWIHLAQGRVGSFGHSNKPSGFMKCG